MGYRIAHVGAFDFENFGDLLFTDVLKSHLQKRIDVEEIICFAPKTCKMPNKAEIVHSVLELEDWIREKKIDAIVVGGGDLVHLRKIITYMPHVSEEGWVIYDVLYMWVIPSLVSLKYEIPLAWNAPGVPLHFGETDKEIVSYLCGAVDYISVRDEEAKKELSVAVNKEKIKVVPDSVLSIKDIISLDKARSIFEKLGLNLQRGNYVFVQFNVSTPESDFKYYADALKFIMGRTGWEILIQPIGYACGDLDVIEKFKTAYEDEFIYPSEHYTQYEILSLIANAAFYIGTSLHGTIVSNSYGVPNIIVNSSHFNKIEGFIQMLGREETRVYSPQEIVECFEKAKNINSSVIVEEKIAEIETHFDRLAEVITANSKNKESSSVNDLASYIHDSSLALENALNENNCIREELEQLQNERNTLKQSEECYKLLYETAINSTSWKITSPLRKISSRLKGNKKSK